MSAPNQERQRTLLSASLQRSYSAFKQEGKLPFVLPDLEQCDAPMTSATGRQERTAASRREQRTPSRSMPNYMLQTPAPPAAMSYTLVPPTALRAQSAAVPPSRPATQLCKPEGLENGLKVVYEVDDAAGIPTLAFFKKPDNSVPRDRCGKIGGAWRHVQQCTGLAGANLLFIDGKVKDQDINRFPPYGVLRTTQLVNRYGQRIVPRVKGQKDKSMMERAREGFQYWYKEPKLNVTEPPAKPVRTILGQQLRIKPI